MDLVGDDEAVVAIDDLGQATQFIDGEDATKRVVGLTQDDRLGSLGEGIANAVKVEGPAKTGVNYWNRDPESIIGTEMMSRPSSPGTSQKGM